MTSRPHSRRWRRPITFVLAALLAMGSLPFTTPAARGAQAQSDLARGRPLFFDPQCPGPFFPLSNLVDGDDTTATQICDMGGAAGHWIAVDLGGTYSISSFRWKDGGAGCFATHPALSGSDGRNDSNVHPVPGDQVWTYNGDIDDTGVVTLATVAAHRYWYLYKYGPDTQPAGCRFVGASFELYGTKAPETTVDLAKGRPVFFDPQCPGPFFPVSNLVDGDDSTFTQICDMGGAANHWIAVDLGGTYRITSFRWKDGPSPCFATHPALIGSDWRQPSAHPVPGDQVWTYNGDINDTGVVTLATVAAHRYWYLYKYGPDTQAAGCRFVGGSFELYGAPPADPLAQSDLARSRPVFFDPQCPGPFFQLAQLVDRDPSTFTQICNNGGTANHWIAVDLGATYRISSFHWKDGPPECWATHPALIGSDDANPSNVHPVPGDQVWAYDGDISDTGLVTLATVAAHRYWYLYKYGPDTQPAGCRFTAGSFELYGGQSNTPPAITALPDRTIFQKDGLTGTVTFVDPDSNQAFTAAVDYGDGATETLALSQAHSFAIRHSYARAGTFTVAIKVTDSAGGLGSTLFHVKVTPKRLMYYIHGTTGSFRQDVGDPTTLDMPTLFGQLATHYGTVRFFQFYEDRGNQDPAARPRCQADGRRPYPTIDPSAGVPLDSAGADPAPGICDSNDDIELNGVLLDDDVRAFAAQFDKVTLISNSGGARIVRSFLAYAAARAAANPTQFSPLSVVDQVVTLEGVQQGTYIAALYNGLDAAAHLDPITAFARDRVVDVVRVAVAHDPSRPTFEDVTPGSRNIVFSNQTEPIPNGIHYVNVDGNIRVNVLQSFFFFTLRTGIVELGDVVMLPGDDDPTAVPDTGGARFLPAAAGRGQSSTEWDLARDFPLVLDPFADLTTVGAILAAPEMHLNFGKKMHDICVGGGDGTIQRLDDALFQAITALDDGTAPDGRRLGFGLAARAECPGVLRAASVPEAQGFAPAAAPRPELIFQDQRSRAVFTVQADVSAADAGHFTLAIPGRGVYSGVASRGRRETEGNRLHINFQGQAQLRSGTPARLQDVRIQLEAELDVARHSGEIQLQDRDYEFHLNARPASTAGLQPAIAAVETSLTANDPTRFYSLLSTTVTGGYSAAAFATAWSNSATSGRITALTRGAVGSVQTDDQGFSYVAVPYTATLTTPSGASSSVAFKMILIYESNAWKFLTTTRQ